MIRNSKGIKGICKGCCRSLAKGHLSKISSSGHSLLASEGDFEGFLKEFSDSSENETSMYDNPECNNMNVMKHFREQTCLPKTNLHHDSHFVEGMRREKSRIKAGEKVQLSDWQQGELGEHAVNPDSVPQPTVDKLGLCNKPKEQSEALKNNVQSESHTVEQKKTVNSRKGMEKSTGVHKKWQKVLGNCAMSDSDSVIKPTTDSSETQFQSHKGEQIKSMNNSARKKLDFVDDKKTTRSKEGIQRIQRIERLRMRQQVEATNVSVDISDSIAKPKASRSIKLHQKSLEEAEVCNSVNNLHGQSIASITLSQSPEKLVHEGEKKIESLNSEILYSLQNKQQILTNIAVVDRLENSCHTSFGSTADLMFKNNQENEQVACTNKALNDVFKETENVTVGGGNSSELHQGQQMIVNGNAATETEAVNNSNFVLLKPTTVVQPIRAGVIFRELSLQKSMPFIPESAAEHLEDKCAQSSRGVLRTDKKSRYSNKENTGYTIVAKEQKKWKQNTGMDVTSGGRTMTRGLAEASGK
jgi:hypothetical protein